MKISTICKSYFNGFYEISNCKNSDKKSTALAVLKILSYFTFVIPLGVGIIYGATTLYGRIHKKISLSQQDKTIHDQAKNAIGQHKEPIQNDSSTQPMIQNEHPNHKITLDGALLLEEAKKYVEDYAKEEGDEKALKLLNYITGILDNPDFKIDPDLYMKHWIEKRGDTEILLVPEDPALEFFKKEICNSNTKFKVSEF